MNNFEMAGAVVSALETSMGLLERLKVLWKRVSAIFPSWATTMRSFDYENDFIEEVLDLRDVRGARALLKKRQRMRFRQGEAAILRDGVWGNGDQFARYQVQGARRVGTRREGMRTTVLLVIEPRPPNGEPRDIRTNRLIKDAFGDANTFFDLMAERPTGYLSLKVLFPRSRPPTSAYLVQAPAETTMRRIPVRYTADRRPFLAWRTSEPQPLMTYSLRWAW